MSPVLTTTTTDLGPKKKQQGMFGAVGTFASISFLLQCVTISSSSICGDDYIMGSPDATIPFLHTKDPGDGRVLTHTCQRYEEDITLGLLSPPTHQYQLTWIKIICDCYLYYDTQSMERIRHLTATNIPTVRQSTFQPSVTPIYGVPFVSVPSYSVPITPDPVSYNAFTSAPVNYWSKLRLCRYGNKDNRVASGDTADGKKK
jgi:hypothetical protein